MKSSLNILFLTDGIPPYVIGGMQKFSLVLSKLLAQKGHQVTLAHCGHINQSKFESDISQVYSESELKNVTPVFVPFILKGKLPGHYIKSSQQYSKLLFDKFKPNLSDFDIIYAQGFTGYSFLQNRNQIPVYVNLHGYEMYQRAPNFKVKLQHFILRPIVKTLTQKADFVLSFGGKIDDILMNDLNINPHKIIEQSNGIEQNWVKTKPLNNQPLTTFTFIGRYERRKGIEELTSALEQLLIERQDFIFNFIGPIPSEKQIEHPSIQYFGEVKQQDQLINTLDQSDFLISPSYAEGMPTVILEAMARGNAILTTDVGANQKLIDGNGWFIKSSPKNIKNNLIKAINIDKSNLLKMKNQSINLIKNKFVWEKVVTDLIKVFTHRG